MDLNFLNGMFDKNSWFELEIYSMNEEKEKRLQCKFLGFNKTKKEISIINNNQLKKFKDKKLKLIMKNQKGIVIFEGELKEEKDNKKHFKNLKFLSKNQNRKYKRIGLYIKTEIKKIYGFNGLKKAVIEDISLAGAKVIVQGDLGIELEDEVILKSKDSIGFDIFAEVKRIKETKISKNKKPSFELGIKFFLDNREENTLINFIKEKEREQIQMLKQLEG